MITKRGEIMTIQVSARIDEETKRQFDEICEGIGTTPSNAISMLIKGVVNHNGIPHSFFVLPAKKPKMTMEEAMGCMKGQWKIPDNFNDPIDDFEEYM
jgi:addiction module RelB/DinJ family antitoxin